MQSIHRMARVAIATETCLQPALGEMQLFGVHVLTWLALVLAEYHLSEIFLVLWTSPAEFEFPATFLLSREYIVAMIFALGVEYFVGMTYFPIAKVTMTRLLSGLGLILVVIGEVIRKCAWITAGFAFTHRVKTVQRQGHALITHGIYAACRHPGYLGWLLWVVGTQLLLANPFSAVLFAVVAWNFFKRRIAYEEFHLSRMFGDVYYCYRSKVPTLIPGIP